MKIGDILTELRNKKGWTQDQMADALDIKRPRYSSWENDIARPDIDMLDKIANIHKVSVDFLLDRSDDPRTVLPNNATWRDNNDLKKFLEKTDIMFDGVPMSDEEKSRLQGYMEAMFWDAKEKNKKKQSDKE